MYYMQLLISKNRFSNCGMWGISMQEFIKRFEELLDEGE